MIDWVDTYGSELLKGIVITFLLIELASLVPVYINEVDFDIHVVPILLYNTP